MTHAHPSVPLVPVPRGVNFPHARPGHHAENGFVPLHLIAHLLPLLLVHRCAQSRVLLLTALLGDIRFAHNVMWFARLVRESSCTRVLYRLLKSETPWRFIGLASRARRSIHYTSSRRSCKTRIVYRTQAVRSDGHQAGHGVQCTFKKQNDGCGHQKRGWIQILYERCRRRLSLLSHGFSGARATPTMSESDPNTQSLTRGGNDGMSWETLFCLLTGNIITIRGWTQLDFAPARGHVRAATLTLPLGFLYTSSPAPLRLPAFS